MKRINIALMSLFLVHFLCLSFTLATQKEIGRDGVYVVYANGIVWDTKAGLENPLQDRHRFPKHDAFVEDYWLVCVVRGD